MNQVSFVRLSEHGMVPIRSSQGAAGYDLFSSCAGTIESHQRQLIPLDISIQLPSGYFAHLLARSGLAVRQGIHVMAGVIDEDYRGNIGVLLYNSSEQPFTFRKGDRIAQMVLKRYEVVEFVEKEQMEESERGTNGFGSTGK